MWDDSNMTHIYHFIKFSAKTFSPAKSNLEMNCPADNVPFCCPTMTPHLHAHVTYIHTSNPTIQCLCKLVGATFSESKIRTYLISTWVTMDSVPSCPPTEASLSRYRRFVRRLRSTDKKLWNGLKERCKLLYVLCKKFWIWFLYPRKHAKFWVSWPHLYETRSRIALHETSSRDEDTHIIVPGAEYHGAKQDFEGETKVTQNGQRATSPTNQSTNMSRNARILV